MKRGNSSWMHDPTVASLSEPSAPDHGPLRLDASREELLDRAAAIVTDAWRSFDRFRTGQPPVDDLVRRLVALRLPEQPTPAFEVLDDAATVLDRSLAQPRPRFFAFVGSSGLEIGVLGDLLASCFDVNLAAWAAAATEVEEQAVRWVGELVGFDAEAGAFTSGGQCPTSRRSPPRGSAPCPDRDGTGSRAGRWPCTAPARRTTR